MILCNLYLQFTEKFAGVLIEVKLGDLKNSLF